MQILFVHQNIPGQFRHLIDHYSSVAGVSVWALGEAARVKANWKNVAPQLNLYGYTFNEKAASFSALHLKSTETNVRRGLAVAKSLESLKVKGLAPDFVVGHPGWGEMLFVRDVFPKAKIVNYCEFYFNVEGQDFGFDPEFPESPSMVYQVRTQNMTQTQSLLAGDVGISPTEWQRSRYPALFRNVIEVAFDGIDCDVVKPDPSATFSVDAEHALSLRDEVITFVNRNLEPHRGYHVFARALPEILRQRPNAHVVIVGGEGTSYSRPLSAGTYKDLYWREIEDKVDKRRVHFVGKLSYGRYLSLLQISAAHIYLTYPFVLSWSLMEAMAASCFVIGSKTSPVEEVICSGENGLLVDFFDTNQLVDAICIACADQSTGRRIRNGAREKILGTYDLKKICIPRQREIIQA
jgi:glycosyltransferase involved in cell wall biosynthesis